MMVNGAALEKGDLLPADSPLLKMPRRIEYYIRTRYLSVRTAPPAPPPVPVVLKKVATTKPDPTPVRTGNQHLADMTLLQLQKQARICGVSVDGSKQQLVKRLSKVI